MSGALRSKLRSKIAEHRSRRSSSLMKHSHAERMRVKETRRTMMDRAAAHIRVQPQEDGSFLLTHPDEDKPLTLSPTDAEDLAVKHIMEGLQMQTDALCTHFRASSDRAEEHGALYLCLNGLDELIHADKLPFKFYTMKTLAATIPDKRTVEALLATGISTHVLVIVNMRVHPRHLEQDDDGTYVHPANFLFLVMNPGTHCCRRGCGKELTGTKADVKTRRGFLYCSNGCKKQDKLARKRMENFINTGLGVQINPVAMQREVHP